MQNRELLNEIEMLFYSCLNDKNELKFENILLVLIGHGEVNQENGKSYFLFPCREEEELEDLEFLKNDFEKNTMSKDNKKDTSNILVKEIGNKVINKLKSLDTINDISDFNNKNYSESFNSVDFRNNINNQYENMDKNLELNHNIVYNTNLNQLKILDKLSENDSNSSKQVDIENIDKSKKKYDKLYYEEIRSIWINFKTQFKYNFKLLLLLDFSSSGGWIGESIDFNDLENNITIYSTCAKGDTSIDIPSIGSILTQQLMTNIYQKLKLESDYENYSKFNKLFKSTQVAQISNVNIDGNFNNDLNTELIQGYQNYQLIKTQILRKIFYKKYLLLYDIIKVEKRVHYYENFDYYNGEWKNSLKHGKGVYYHYLRKETYKGEYKNDQKSGKGIYYFRTGSVYKGEWKDDKINGNGRFYYFNGDAYVGEWKNSIRHGIGTYFYSDGCVYRGNWVDDKKRGHGIFYDNEDGRYEGEWFNDKKHGLGVYYYNTGDRLVGEWKNDEIIENRNVYYYKESNKTKVM